MKSCLARFSGIFALSTPSNIHGTAISYRCAKFGAFVNSVTILTLRDLTIIIGVIRENCFLWSSFHIKNTHSLCRFSYVCLSFNYVSSCLLDVQLGSILSFNYYFLSLNYPWSFSHLITTVCHAISYLMNFIELWLVAIQLVNIVSISIDRLYLSPQKHRWLLTLRISTASFNNVNAHW